MTSLEISRILEMSERLVNKYLVLIEKKESFMRISMILITHIFDYYDICVISSGNSSVLYR